MKKIFLSAAVLIALVLFQIEPARSAMILDQSLQTKNSTVYTTPKAQTDTEPRPTTAHYVVVSLAISSFMIFRRRKKI